MSLWERIIEANDFWLFLDTCRQYEGGGIRAVEADPTMVQLGWPPLREQLQRDEFNHHDVLLERLVVTVRSQLPFADPIMPRRPDIPWYTAVMRPRPVGVGMRLCWYKGSFGSRRKEQFRRQVTRGSSWEEARRGYFALVNSLLTKESENGPVTYVPNGMEREIVSRGVFGWDARRVG